MSRRKPRPMLKLFDLTVLLSERLRSPLGVILGMPRDTAEFVAARPGENDLIYHMDLYEADRVQEELDRRRLKARVFVAPDLWDVAEPLQTLVYPAPATGERMLKVDMIEQAFHALAPGGTLIVLTPFERDQLFQPALKKVFKKVHVPESGNGAILWCKKEGDRPRRRHEVTFHVQRAGGPSLVFVSRPGVFSYGRFDNGARALMEVAQIEPDDRILDVGCGVGTNGVIAGLRAGEQGEVVFVDSNVRALALAEINARGNGLARFRTVASSRLDDIGAKGFDVALANPPYFAKERITRLFVERSRSLLRPGGRFYLVTRQPAEVGALIVRAFPDAEYELRRGYTVFIARKGEGEK